MNTNTLAFILDYQKNLQFIKSVTDKKFHDIVNSLMDEDPTGMVNPDELGIYNNLSHYNSLADTFALFAKVVSQTNNF